MILTRDHCADVRQGFKHAQTTRGEVERVDVHGATSRRDSRADRECAQQHGLSRAARAVHSKVPIDVGHEPHRSLRLLFGQICDAENEFAVGPLIEAREVIRIAELGEPRLARKRDLRTFSTGDERVHEPQLVGRAELHHLGLRRLGPLPRRF